MEVESNVIIIGGDHHNTLSVIRCFGKKKINYQILIHSDKINEKQLMLYYSRYCKNLHMVNDSENEILNWLIERKKEKKQIIIPCSDLAEYTIDNNYNKLKEYYYIPGFKDNPGEVCRLMDKYEQSKWLEKNNIKSARTWFMDISNKIEIPEDMIYPCIIKPNVSAKGCKGDIKICHDANELLESIKTIYANYSDVIVQQYLNKKYELLAMGYISDDGYNSGGVERKLRETIPGGGGSTALGRFTNEKNIIDFANAILDVLYKSGYRGLYDIEFFECHDGLYLNEVNFRHSGSGFALIKNGIMAPYLYYLDCLNIDHDNVYKLKHPNGYFVCDFGEFNLLRKYKSINIFQFFFDFIRAYAHSIIDIKDLGVLKYYIWYRRKLKVENKKK